MQVRRAIVARRIVSYITDVVATRLNEIIQITAEDPGKFGTPIDFRSWEKYVSQQWKNPWINFAGVLVHIGRSGLQLIIIIALLVGYVFLRIGDQTYVPTLIDTFLLTLNGLLLVVSLVSLAISVGVFSDKIKP